MGVQLPLPAPALIKLHVHYCGMVRVLIPGFPFATSYGGLHRAATNAVLKSSTALTSEDFALAAERLDAALGNIRFVMADHAPEPLCKLPWREVVKEDRNASSSAAVPRVGY